MGGISVIFPGSLGIHIENKIVPTNYSQLEKLSIGAARGIRTPDPVITNDVLYQLSYCGEAGLIGVRT